MKIILKIFRDITYKKILIFFLIINISCSKNSSDETTSSPSYTVKINPVEGGTLSSTGGTYGLGKVLTISATPKDGYVFTGWSNGSSSNPISITVNSNIDISPSFEKAIVKRIELSLDKESLIMGGEANLNYVVYSQNDIKLNSVIPNISLSDTILAKIQDGKVITEYDGELKIYGKINEVIDSVSLIIKPDYNNWKTFFRPLKDGVPDLSNICNNGGNCASTNSVKIDLNKDGREDLLIHFFKDRDQINVPFDGPTYNRLIALISDENGKLINRTSEVLGSEIIDLSGGASRNHEIFDINQDGYMDVIFALNREDGRSLVNRRSWFTLSVAVISNGDGTYRTESFGEEGFFHDIDIHRDQNGNLNIIIGDDDFQGANPRNLYSYRYNGGSFSDYATVVQNRDGGTISSFSDVNNVIKYLVASKDTLGGLDFYENNGAGLLKKKEFIWGYTFEINFTDWMGDTRMTKVKVYNGNTFIGGGFWDSTFLKLSPNEDPVYVIHYSAQSYMGEVNPGDVLNNQQTRLMSKVFAFDNSPSTEELNIFPNQGLHELNVNFIETLDVNNDQYDDLIKYPYRFEGKPIVLLNNKSGSFSELNNPNIFPSNLEGVDTSQFIDVNGDGIYDMIFWNSMTSNEYFQPLLFLGRKPLSGF